LNAFAGGRRRSSNLADLSKKDRPVLESETHIGAGVVHKERIQDGSAVSRETGIRKEERQLSQRDEIGN
jgi:hypothetical protein